MYGVENLMQTFQAYAGTTMFLSAFWVCVIYVFCYGKESGRKRLLFVFILSLLFVFNDLSIKVMGKITDQSTYLGHSNSARDRLDWNESSNGTGKTMGKGSGVRIDIYSFLGWEKQFSYRRQHTHSGKSL